MISKAFPSGFIKLNNCSYLHPTKSVPLYSFKIEYSERSSKYLFNASFAKMTFIFSLEYWLTQDTFTYSMFLLTANALLAGNVQGVVVQAIKKVFSSFKHLNIAVTVTSLTIL